MQCLRCLHEWEPRTDGKPRQCPSCKSPRWYQPVTAAAAQYRVKAAIASGKLPALDGTIKCVDCGKPAHVYDHRDYAKPLDVEAVCISCNRLRGRAANTNGHDRRPIATYLTADELNQLKIAALRLNTHSIHLATAAIRLAINPDNEQYFRELLDSR